MCQNHYKECDSLDELIDFMENKMKVFPENGLYYTDDGRKVLGELFVAIETVLNKYPEVSLRDFGALGHSAVEDVVTENILIRRDKYEQK